MAKKKPNARFAHFLARVLEPGPIVDDAQRIDVRTFGNWTSRGDHQHALWLDNRENDMLQELEIIPLPRDDASTMLAVASGLLRRWAR
jgi:hypothetical protein